MKSDLFEYLSGKYGALIGRGAFSLVFRKEKEDFVTILSVDKAKECAAYFGLNSLDCQESEDLSGILFPKIEFQQDSELDEILEKYYNPQGVSNKFKGIRGIENAKLYKMRYFPRVKSLKSALKPDQWELYLKLRQIMNKGIFADSNWGRIDKYRELFNELPGKYGEIMNAALDSLISYGDSISFEISPRNVAVDIGENEDKGNGQGNLVLLDCFFFREDLGFQRK